MRLLTLCSLLTVAACASGPTEAPRELTELPRALTASETEISARSNRFAFDLFRRTAADPDANSFVSPLSVSMALGMTMHGAANATLDSMRRTLGFEGMTLAEINAGYAGLVGLLLDLDRTTELRIGNAIWVRPGLTPHPDFVAAARNGFAAEARPLDFSLPTAPDTINGWASRATNGRITEVVESLSRDLVMLLANAIYFKGAWRDAFDPDKTTLRPFAASVGGPQSVRMMTASIPVRSVMRPDYSAIELPYGNGAFAMTLLLPAPGRDVHDLVDSLTPARWAEMTEAFVERQLVVGLPKFTLKASRLLNDDLSALGMGIAFDDGRADLRNLFTPAEPGPFISFVKHDSFLSIDERGTEAAAVTTVGITVVSLPPSFIADRPFVLAIRERFSGTILFLGKIVRVPE